jgi:hypothetical protein
MFVYTPSGKRGLPFDGGGEPIPYAEALTYTVTCGSAGDAHAFYRDITMVWFGTPEGSSPPYKAVSLGSIGNEAAAADASDTQEYPSSRTFLLAVRSGRRIGVVGIEAPSDDSAVNSALVNGVAKTLATTLGSFR